MNYYYHHIGDYANATRHFSLLEDAIYMRLLWTYYRDERPLPRDLGKVAWLIGLRTRKEKSTLEMILNEYFTLQDDGWHNARADEEIATYQSKQSAAQENGKKGGRPKNETPAPLPALKPENGTTESQAEPNASHEKPSDNPEETQGKPTHNPPITQAKANQSPISNKKEPFQINLKGGVGENVSATEPSPTTAPTPSASPPDAAPQGGSLFSPLPAKAGEQTPASGLDEPAPPACQSGEAGKAGRQEGNGGDHPALDGTVQAHADAIGILPEADPPSPKSTASHPIAPTSPESAPLDTHVAGCGRTPLCGASAATSDKGDETAANADIESAKPRKNKKRERCTLRTALEDFYGQQPEGDDRHFISADDPVHEWAEKIGLPNDFLLLAWIEFERRHVDTRKLQKDWRAHFRNACRGNWYHLWYITDDGDYQLTVAGIQLRREQEADAEAEAGGDRAVREPGQGFAGEGEIVYDARDSECDHDGQDHSAALLARLFGEGVNPFSPNKWLN